VNPERTASPDASPNRCSLPGLAGLKARIVARLPGIHARPIAGRLILLGEQGCPELTPVDLELPHPRPTPHEV